MYSYYDITLSNKDNEYTFRYQIEEHRVAQVWANLISKHTPLDLRPSLYPWRGVYKNYEQKVNYLNELIKKLNTWISDPIKDLWDTDNPHASLNKLHIHFPDEEKKTKDYEKIKQLSEYNDLIHEISGFIIAKSANRENLHLLLCCDRGFKEKLIEQDFTHFTTQFKFGDLKLHYCHVGRHPLEIYINKDITCPEHQILPQYEISPFHTLTFFDATVSNSSFEKFYYESKLNWPYQLNDPRLAVGYINLGKLISVNSIIYSNNEITGIVKSCNKISKWNIY